MNNHYIAHLYHHRMAKSQLVISAFSARFSRSEARCKQLCLRARYHLWVVTKTPLKRIDDASSQVALGSKRHLCTTQKTWINMTNKSLVKSSHKCVWKQTQNQKNKQQPPVVHTLLQRRCSWKPPNCPCLCRKMSFPSSAERRFVDLT